MPVWIGTTRRVVSVTTPHAIRWSPPVAKYFPKPWMLKNSSSGPLPGLSGRPVSTARPWASLVVKTPAVATCKPGTGWFVSSSTRCTLSVVVHCGTSPSSTSTVPAASCVIAPLVPRTVMGWLILPELSLALSVRSDCPFGITPFGEKNAVTPAGRFGTDSVTGCLKPLVDTTLTCRLADPPGLSEMVVGFTSRPKSRWKVTVVVATSVAPWSSITFTATEYAAASLQVPPQIFCAASLLLSPIESPVASPNVPSLFRSQVAVSG